MKAAAFKAYRETVGASQQDVADALGVDKRSVKRWEAGINQIPEMADELILSWLDNFHAGVSAALDAADGIGRVQLTYYRTQEQYDQYGRDSGQVGRANAIAREVGDILISDGVSVDWAYPDDSDNVYHGAK